MISGIGIKTIIIKMSFRNWNCLNKKSLVNIWCIEGWILTLQFLCTFTKYFYNQEKFLLSASKISQEIQLLKSWLLCRMVNTPGVRMINEIYSIPKLSENQLGFRQSFKAQQKEKHSKSSKLNQTKSSNFSFLSIALKLCLYFMHKY